MMQVFSLDAEITADTLSRVV